MQRFTLERILDEAAAIVRHKGTATDQDELQALHNNTLDFTVTGYLTEISNREVINQFYRLAQTGLRVPETFQIVQHSLHYIDINNDAKFQRHISGELRSVVKQLDENVNDGINRELGLYGTETQCLERGE
jgi:FPC/CPF motif-containing protein YcgG